MGMGMGIENVEFLSGLMQAIEKIKLRFAYGFEVDVKWFLFCWNDYCWFNYDRIPLHFIIHTCIVKNTHCTMYTQRAHTHTHPCTLHKLWSTCVTALKALALPYIYIRNRELNKPEKHWWQKNCIHPQIVCNCGAFRAYRENI